MVMFTETKVDTYYRLGTFVLDTLKHWKAQTMPTFVTVLALGIGVLVTSAAVSAVVTATLSTPVVEDRATETSRSTYTSGDTSADTDRCAGPTPAKRCEGPWDTTFMNTDQD